MVGTDQAIAIAPLARHGRHLGLHHPVDAADLAADLAGDLEEDAFRTLAPAGKL